MKEIQWMKEMQHIYVACHIYVTCREESNTTHTAFSSIMQSSGMLVGKHRASRDLFSLYAPSDTLSARIQSCHAHQRIMSHMLTIRKQSRYSFQWVIPHTSTRHATRLNENLDTHQRFTHINESYCTCQ